MSNLRYYYFNCGITNYLISVFEIIFRFQHLFEFFEDCSKLSHEKFKKDLKRVRRVFVDYAGNSTPSVLQSRKVDFYLP